MTDLTSKAWWKAALFRMLRTVGVLLAPYLPTVLYTNEYGIIASVIGFGAVLSILTSITGIAESEGKVVPWWYAIGERSVKTAAQSLLTFVGTATMFHQVNWAEALPFVGTAVLGTLLIAFMGFLPETDGKTPLAPAVLETVTITPEGEQKAVEVPVVASSDSGKAPVVVQGTEQDGIG